MSQLFLIFLVKLILCFNLILCSKFNISVTDMGSCKTLRLAKEYGYNYFFLIEDMNTNRDEGEILRLKFYVMAAKDAHILLSSNDNPKPGDRVYEIVIGAGGNTFSTIRGSMGSNRLAGSIQSGILSPVDPTPIEVRQIEDMSSTEIAKRRLEVIIPTQPEYRLNYTDPSPFPIKYLSFGTFGSTPSRWFYDCKIDKDTNQIELEKRNMTDIERLEHDLSVNNSIYIPPANLRAINFSFVIHGVSHDEKRSILKTRMTLSMNWPDTSKTLQWNPEKYGNLTSIQTAGYSHWTPSIMVINGAGSSYHEFDPGYFGYIYSNGTVKVKSSQVIVDTWCRESSKNWPYDDLQCDILLGVHGAQLKLVYDNSSPVGNSHVTGLSEWHLVTIIVRNENNVNVSNDTFELEQTKHDLRISLKLKRNRLFYRRVFFTPLVVSCLIILFSFFLDGTLRGGMNLLGTVLTSFSMMFLSKYSPVTYVPQLLQSYQVVMISSCFTYILHIYTLWLLNYPPLYDPPLWLKAVTSFSGFRVILQMHFVDANDYLRIQKFPWKDVATFLNRILFIIFTILYSWILVISS